ncbi:MAG: YjzC family protein [Sphaerochaetaceae bacterium]|jgi:hypothetical protein|nr:YjzC family protein [Sphaerochaetaceae bacterium]MDX9939627.1 YjzC family protein [Sphaerochaetaceae bacterium]
MAIGDIRETGRKSEHFAEYVWVSYADGTQEPEPQEDEMRITVGIGEHLPVVISSGKAALWRMSAYID